MDVNYLDAQVIVSEGKSIIDLYVKQTDIHVIHTTEQINTLQSSIKHESDLFGECFF